MMQKNKYDLVESITKFIDTRFCKDCPIYEECGTKKYLCKIEDKQEEVREILIKKYNL